MKTLGIRFFSVVLALAVPAVGLAAYHETGSSEAVFAATGSMGLRLEGHAHPVRVSDDGSNLTVTVALDHLETGIEMRDQHTKEFLDVAHHPTATLTVPRASLTLPTTAATEGDAHGTMNIHGQSHDVAFHYRAEPGANGFHVRGTTRVDVRHYGLTPPSYLGVRVNPDVSVRVDFHVQDR